MLLTNNNNINYESFFKNEYKKCFPLTKMTDKSLKKNDKECFPQIIILINLHFKNKK